MYNYYYLKILLLRKLLLFSFLICFFRNVFVGAVIEESTNLTCSDILKRSLKLKKSNKSKVSIKNNTPPWHFHMGFAKLVS